MLKKAYTDRALDRAPLEVATRIANLVIWACDLSIQTTSSLSLSRSLHRSQNFILSPKVPLIRYSEQKKGKGRGINAGWSHSSHARTSSTFPRAIYMSLSLSFLPRAPFSNAFKGSERARASKSPFLESLPFSGLFLSRKAFFSPLSSTFALFSPLARAATVVKRPPHSCPLSSAFEARNGTVLPSHFLPCLGPLSLSPWGLADREE